MISRCCLIEECFDYLCEAIESSRCKLKMLDISGNNLSNRNVRMLCRALRHNIVMRTLNLSRDSFSEMDMRERSENDMSSRSFDSRGVYEIAKMLEVNNALEFLVLTNVTIHSTAALALGNALKKNVKLRYLLSSKN